MVCSAQYIVEKYGIYPNQYAYFKSLVGDTADNIKGAEKIIRNAGDIDKPSIKNSIIENTDRIRRNYELIHLEKNQLLQYDKCDLEFTDVSKTKTEVLKGIFVFHKNRS